MLCCRCKKNQATKSYMRTLAGKQKAEYYCLDCYRNGFLSVEMDGEDNGRSFEICPYCGTSAEDFKRTTLVGCAMCYKTIGTAVIPTLITMQGGEVHVGKKGAGQEEKLRLRLEELMVLYESYKREGDEKRAYEVAQEYKRLQSGTQPDRKGGYHGSLA